MIGSKDYSNIVFDWDACWRDARNMVDHKTVIRKYRKGRYLVNRSVLEQRKKAYK